ncbi:YerC/YecD family TrpR-related protein [Haloplasma contractile]|uniref:TrpR like protein YerC-YecD n=1 Tax=Haloplasma contractile SSD-17B TaxID=1033810 RepID=U2FPM8_9MOLU|nr:YerC/YecD family TrpR-related protein [Haloplasma contractile]ERJ13004.1 TrpR like protein YerC-YecD [Haloplasma contractile SSD-17B]
MPDMNEQVDYICDIFSKANNKEDVLSILEDVCTTKELDAIFQRFKIAQMLRDGLTFSKIEELTGISSTTITRVSKCLKNGQGYKKVFNEFDIKIKY